ncbi:hypothetical protein [Paenibacillus glycanilyticus]|uniref:hypothetical protein n=1 Tax=Paenibacillus glycanilyticus TaxID=126569 RepID=UPI000FDB333E|nr:hypothetical protein [Paenibacillus glycanilyticus]
MNKSKKRPKDGEVTAFEKSIDYGFFDDYENKDRFYDINGDLLFVEPQYSSFVGLASYGAIGRRLHIVINGENILI